MNDASISDNSPLELLTSAGQARQETSIQTNMQSVVLVPGATISDHLKQAASRLHGLNSKLIQHITNSESTASSLLKELNIPGLSTQFTGEHLVLADSLSFTPEWNVQLRPSGCMLFYSEAHTQRQVKALANSSAELLLATSFNTNVLDKPVEVKTIVLPCRNRLRMILVLPERSIRPSTLLFQPSFIDHVREELKTHGTSSLITIQLPACDLYSSTELSGPLTRLGYHPLFAAEYSDLHCSEKSSGNYIESYTHIAQLSLSESTKPDTFASSLVTIQHPAKSDRSNSSWL